MSRPTITASPQNVPNLSRREQELRTRRKGKGMWTKTMTAGTSVWRTFWKDKNGKWTGKTTRTVVFTDPLPWASTTWSTFEHTMWVSKHAPTFTWFKSLPSASSETRTIDGASAPTLLPRDPKTKEPLETRTITFGTSRYMQTYLSGEYSTTETQFRTFTDPLPWSATLQRTVTLTMEVPVPVRTHAHAKKNPSPTEPVNVLPQGPHAPVVEKAPTLPRRDPEVAIQEGTNKSVTKSIMITTTFIEKVPWPRTKANVFPRSKITTTFVEEIPDNKPYPITTSIILEMPWPRTTRPPPSPTHWWNRFWPHKSTTTTSSPRSKTSAVVHQMRPITKRLPQRNERSLPTPTLSESKLAVTTWDAAFAYSPSETRYDPEATTLTL